jgi:2-oxoglutarate ferredoxin oxidoreductase subunit delta
MAGRIVIDIERCKGCGLCVAVCPKKGIVISKVSNKSGYFPAQKTDAECTGCAMCTIICPEAIITVGKEIQEKAKSRFSVLDTRRNKKTSIEHRGTNIEHRGR